MRTLLIGYIILMNLWGFALMGIDKWKAKRGRWRISEKALFLTAFLGGSIGSLVGIYLFRHKTRHLRFTIGIPVIMVLQLLAIIFFFIYRQEQLQSPSAAVSNELALIQELDETTIKNFVSYENMMAAESADSALPQAGPETTEAVKLFFQNFKYHLHSEEINGDTATVSVEIINIDTQALAKDLCRALTARSLNISSDSQSPKTLNDYYILLRDTLKNNTYDLTATTAYFHLKKSNNSWVIQADETLQDELVSGFISWLNDSGLLTPQEVLTICLDAFASLTADQWMDYLDVRDIFSTYSETYFSAVDQAYMEKIAEYFSYSIDSCTASGTASASAVLTITSIDMPCVLESYRAKLLKYARTSESITSDEAGLSDASARYLLESLREDARPATFQVNVTLDNDKPTWHLDISDELTNAFLGNIRGALEHFNSAA